MHNVPKSGDYSPSFNKFVFDEIPEGSTVLDVGCWNGNLGAELMAKKGCVVDGVDVNAEVLAEAKSRGYRKTFQINLNNDPLPENSVDERYDVIVLADVLEHLVDPKRVLEYLAKNMNKGGIVVVSLPNVAFLLNRIKLLLGNWDYTEFGTLDKTHLKFFTIKTAKKLLENSGLEVIKLLPYNQFGLLRYLDPLMSIAPGALSYQILLVGKAK